MSFHGLTAHFILALNNILLSGWTTVYLTSHVLKDIFVASVLTIMNKAAINIRVQVFVCM